MKRAYTFGFAILIGFLIWLLPRPEGVQPQAWNLLAIFVATMIAVVLRPFPMGFVSVMALAVTVATGTLSFADAFSGFSNDVVWLIVFAFFVARGFIATGLGNRLAYKVMSILGKNSLGLGYGLVATDLILAPAIPSVTARIGGIVFPIVKGLAQIFTGASHDPRMGGFLTLTSYQGSAITSAMFLTAMAGNPLIAELARGQGIEITWGIWAIAALVPGLISLVAIPSLLFYLISPTIRKTPHAKEMASNKLKEMGPMSSKEWIMLGTFVLMIILWIIGPKIDMKAPIAAMIGLIILLFSDILTWKDVIEETSAWDTFIWFATLVTLSGFLNKLGLSTWFSSQVVFYVSGFSWITGFLLIALLYFYTHYFFASAVAHIGAMFAPLLIIAVALGTPPQLAVLTLGFFSNLFAGLTHYGSGPAPILFGTGYVTVATWWKFGFIVSVANIAIWLIVGGLWWKILGLW
ncbi:MAG: anion permease [Verrucomicrobia bacterium]|nr:anion permease [Verrucomicrobiota bacterium]